MQAISDLDSQADSFGRYLIGKAPDTVALRLYVNAMEHNPPPLEAEDEKLLKFIARHPRSTGLVDAGLALVRPHSEVRRRLYVMLAILEASPEYVRYYLPQKRSPLYLIVLTYTGLRASMKAIVGAILVKSLGRS